MNLSLGKNCCKNKQEMQAITEFYLVNPDKMYKI